MQRPLILAVLVLTAGFSAAEEPGEQPTAEADPSESSPPTFRDELDIPARALASPTSAATLIDREAIEATGTRTVAGLLAYVEGVHVLDGVSRGGPSAAQIRGGDPNFSLILLDGVPLNNAADLEGGAVNLAALSTSHVERIEVVRGPQSYFYGPNGLAGVINIVTRRGDTPAPTVQVGMEAGSLSLLQAETSVSGSRGKGDYFAGMEWEEEAHRLGNDAFEQLSAITSLGIPVGERAKLRLGARAASSDTDDYPDASGGPVFGSGELRHSEKDDVSIGVDLVMAGIEFWRHRLTASLHKEEIERSSPAVGFVVPRSTEDISYTRLNATWLTSRDLSDALVLAAGLYVETENAENRSVLFLPPFLGGDVAGDYDLTRTTPGAFAELAMERGKYLFEAGVRADSTEQGTTEWSPRLGIRYRIGDDRTLLRATASRAFKLPSLLALGSPQALGGNPGLLPETSEGVDFGVEHRFGSGATMLRASTFLTRYEDLIEFDFDAFRLLNRSRVEVRGVELAWRWRPRSQLQLDANVTWQDVEDLDVSATPLHQPEWRGAASFVWEPVDPLTLSLRARSISKSLDQQLTVPDRNSVDGYETFDCSLAWHLTDRWTIRAQVENLADDEHENFIGFPAPGRSGRIGVRYQLVERKAESTR